MPRGILGLSAFYHDSAAVMLVDGRIAAASQEERFTRKKHDSDFPANAVRYVLDESGLTPEQIEAVAFYDKPLLKFERLLETYHGFAPQGLRSFRSAIPVWIKEKLFMRRLLRDELAKVGLKNPRLLFPEHHLSHAASAFFPSPFERAAVLTVDGVGEWATTTIGLGERNRLEILRELHFPHSLGLLYSAFTAYCGFKVNSGEYKLMGLAPYAVDSDPLVVELRRKTLEELVDLRPDGSLLLNMRYFDYATGLKMCNDQRWRELFGIPPRSPETEIGHEYMALARAVQSVTEEAMLRLARTARELANAEYLVMAGGVALNCVANGILLREGIFKDIWIQPAAGDAGGALGAALSAWHVHQGEDRVLEPNGRDAMRGAYLGPSFSRRSCERVSQRYGAPCVAFDDEGELCQRVAGLIAEGHVVGWFQGRMEYGPRALGNRSILADPRNAEMQKKLNLKIKYREGFRPFAPSVLEERCEEYFVLDRPSPYMLLVAPVQAARRSALPMDYEQRGLYDRLYVLRSDIPAVTHVDFSARIQSVSKEDNPRYWKLIETFRERHGCGLLVNTSFNVRGEPIVCTPQDGYACFMRTEMDYLVLGDLLFDKKDQPTWRETSNWREIYELD